MVHKTLKETIEDKFEKDENKEYVESKGSITRINAQTQTLMRLKLDTPNSAPVTKCGDFIIDNTDVSTMLFRITITFKFLFFLNAYFFIFTSQIWKKFMENEIYDHQSEVDTTKNIVRYLNF